MTLGFLPPFQTHQRSSQLQTAPKPLRNRSETAPKPLGIRSHSPRKRSNKEINERIGLKSSNDNPMITTAATAATTTATITIMMMITVINNPDKKRGQKRETEREGNGGKKNIYQMECRFRPVEKRRKLLLVSFDCYYRQLLLVERKQLVAERKLLPLSRAPWKQVTFSPSFLPFIPFRWLVCLFICLFVYLFIYLFIY